MLMLSHVVILTIVATLGLINPVKAQFPINGDVGALNKMKQAQIVEKMTIERLEKRDAAIEDRAIHFMLAAEKANRIQEFISRGSKFLPDGGEPVEKNKNIGEQIIDPRTPNGFGNPFFRQINVEQTVELRKMISDNEIVEMRKLDDGIDPVINSGWIAVEARGAMRDKDKRRGEFMALWWASPNRIIRRLCESCDDPEYKEIYYKRTNEDGMTRKILDIMVDGNFISTNCVDENCRTTNQCNADFTLHSTYADAKGGTEKWKQCCPNNGEVVMGFPGLSGPNNPDDQAQYNLDNIAQPDYAFYVEESVWIPIAGSHDFELTGLKSGNDIKDILLDEAKAMIYKSANRIIRRVCRSCDSPYDDLYFQAIANPTDDIMHTLLVDFDVRYGNFINRDFKIFFTYEDALQNKNYWEYCGDNVEGEHMGFPGRCKPKEDTVMPNIWQTYEENLKTYKEGAVHVAFYVEQEGSPDTDAWMTEDDEMKAFFDPGSTLEKEDDFVCKNPSYDDTEQITFDYTPTSLEAYILQGREDEYAGYYDIQGCGRCNDWCGWFSTLSVGDSPMNPYYKSWTEDDVFACIMGSAESGMKYSGRDDTPVTASYIQPEFKSPMNYLTGFLRFFPSSAQKCEGLNYLAPLRPDFEYVGCFNELSPPALPVNAGARSVRDCFVYCRDLGYHYFARQGLGICMCGGETESDTGYAIYGESGSGDGISNTYAPYTCGHCGGNNIGANNNCVWQIMDPVTRAPTTGPDPTASPTFHPDIWRCNENNPCTRGLAAGKCCSRWGWCGDTVYHCWASLGCTSNCQYVRHLSVQEYSYFNVNNTTMEIPDIEEEPLNNQVSSNTVSPLVGRDHAALFNVPSTPGSLTVCQVTNYVGDNDNTGGNAFTDGPFAMPIECIKVSYYFGVLTSVTVKPHGGDYGPSHGKVHQEREWCIDFANGEFIVKVEGKENDQYGVGMEYLRFTTNFYNVKHFNADGAFGIMGDTTTFDAPSGCTLGGLVGKAGNGLDTVGVIWVANPTQSFDTQRRLVVSNTCSLFGSSHTNSEFGGLAIPYKYKMPPLDDPYAGWYDIQRCGKCNDWCGWVGPLGNGIGLNPRWKERTNLDYFACKLAGGYSSDFGLTSMDHFEGGFHYQKCTGKGEITPAYRKEKFVGCYRDTKDRGLPVQVGRRNVSLSDCVSSCRTRGYHFAGRQYKGQCLCGGIKSTYTSYAKHGMIPVTSPEYCDACDGPNVGNWKQCVFQILDQFDPEAERKKHPCTHITFTDLRRYCYVSCRDSEEHPKNLMMCKKMSAMGAINLNNEIAAWLDSPFCNNDECTDQAHPLGEDVVVSIGVF